MKRVSPTAEGFRVMFRHPSIGLAEIVWRWSFGLSLTFLATISFFEFLDTLPVSNADLFLMRTKQPFLISQAISHILRGSGPRVILTALALAITMSAAWAVVASFGRVATLNDLFYRVPVGLASDTPTRMKPAFRTLLGLNFLRLSAFFAASLALFGAVLLIRLISPDSDPSPGSAFAIFLLFLLLIGTAAAMLNWFLSLASIFANSGSNTFSALESAVDLCRDRFGPVLAVSSWFGLAHTVLLLVASSFVAFPLGFAGLLPPAVVIGGVLLMTLVYFAIVDFLYIGRLAGYLAVLKMPEIPESVPVPPQPPQRPQCVDQDELILSDVPLLP